MRRREPAVLALMFLIITGLTVYSFFARDWMPRVASEHGALIDGLIRYLLIATGIIFVVGHFVLAWFIWRYREGEERTAGPQVSAKTEWACALAPVLIMALIAEFGVLVLGMPVWAQIYGESPKDAVTIEVVGKQFEWIVRYPGKDGKFGKTDPKLVHPTDNPLGLVEEDPAATDDVVEKTLVLPAGRHIVLKIRSHDVIHSVSIPEFRVKQDAMPGFTATTKFIPTTPGRYELACTELCGMGHYKMRALIDVKLAKDFDTWMSEQQGFFE